MLQFFSFQVRKPCKNLKCFYFNHKFFRGWENSLGIRFQPISTLHPPLAFMRKIANNCPGDGGLGASGRPAARSRVWGLVPGIPVFQARQGPTSTPQEVYLSTPSLCSSGFPFCPTNSTKGNPHVSQSTVPGTSLLPFVSLLFDETPWPKAS